jgi:hypothetical protein
MADYEIQILNSSGVDQDYCLFAESPVLTPGGAQSTVVQQSSQVSVNDQFQFHVKDGVVGICGVSPGEALAPGVVVSINEAKAFPTPSGALEVVVENQNAVFVDGVNKGTGTGDLRIITGTEAWDQNRKLKPLPCSFRQLSTVFGMRTPELTFWVGSPSLVRCWKRVTRWKYRAACRMGIRARNTIRLRCPANILHFCWQHGGGNHCQFPRITTSRKN